MSDYSLSASGFEEKIGVGRATISHLLSGRNKPSLDFILKIIQVFPEVDLYWLIDGRKPLAPTPTNNPTPVKKYQTDISPIIATTDETKNIEEAISIAKSFSVNPTNTEQKILKRVVLLYTDGSFESYTT